jgi:tetratricopeptide (TPR) repeat protein
MMAKASKFIDRFNFQHGLVLLIGLLVFVLLILANKTQLESGKSAAFATADSTGSAEAPPAPVSTDLAPLLNALPPPAPDPSLDSLQTALAASSVPSDRAVLYRAMVDIYKSGDRFDIAAVYAGALADEQPEVGNLLVAGALFRNAGFLEHLQADSSLFARFSDEALRHLRTAETLEPKNEEVLLELGLAMVESRKGEMSMEGILKIRTVTELNPRNVEALYRLGIFSMDTKQYDKAEQRFRQVLEIDPGIINAQFLLALACQEQGKVAEFKKHMTAVAGQSQDIALADRAKSFLNQP